MSCSAHLALGLFGALSLVACGGYTHDPGSFFPATWNADFVEVSTCQLSKEHGGSYVRVFADQAAAGGLKAGTTPYPEGSVFLKPQYSDAACTDQQRWTVMKKGPAGTAAASGDWIYQVVDGDGSVKVKGQPKMCVKCHEDASESDYVYTSAQ